MSKLTQIQAVYETSSRNVVGKGILRNEDINVRVFIHDGKIEIIDEDMDLKSFVFTGKDTPEKRAYWLRILKTIETAIKLTPSGKE